MGLFTELKIKEIKQKLEAINKRAEAEKKPLIKELKALLLERQEDKKANKRALKSKFI